ncbi:Multidrug resistance-associated protein 1, partial [Coemansia sp. RSA 2399]
MNDTVRKNILFGRDYDEAHYNRVVDACALAEDINNWTGGDQTIIGERGINISGGQKARLALARTVYSKADIYVLDDPLSAVDAHVKRHILDNVIMDSGLLGGKIRIVSVNAEHILPYCNQVIRLDSGKASVTKQDPQEFQPRANIHSAESDEVQPHDPESTDSSENADLTPVSPAAECSDNTELDSSDELSTPDDDNTSSGIHEWGKWDNLRYI